MATSATSMLGPVRDIGGLDNLSMVESTMRSAGHQACAPHCNLRCTMHAYHVGGAMLGPAAPVSMSMVSTGAGCRIWA